MKMSLRFEPVVRYANWAFGLGVQAHTITNGYELEHRRYWPDDGVWIEGTKNQAVPVRHFILSLTLLFCRLSLLLVYRGKPFPTDALVCENGEGI
jgi:hypothetical protein